MDGSTASMRVATRSSVAGSSRAFTPKRAAIRAVTCDIVAPRGEQVRAHEVRREIEVAEVEPRPLRAEGPQLLRGAERLLTPTPPAFAVEDVAEPVRDGVGVGGDAEAVDVVVVGHVHDHGEVVSGHHADESAQELAGSDAPRQRDDLHRRTA